MSLPASVNLTVCLGSPGAPEREISLTGGIGGEAKRAREESRTVHEMYVHITVVCDRRAAFKVGAIMGAVCRCRLTAR